MLTGGQLSCQDGGEGFQLRGGFRFLFSLSFGACSAGTSPASSLRHGEQSSPLTSPLEGPCPAASPAVRVRGLQAECTVPVPHGWGCVSAEPLPTHTDGNVTVTPQAGEAPIFSTLFPSAVCVCDCECMCVRVCVCVCVSQNVCGAGECACGSECVGGGSASGCAVVCVCV